MKKPLYFLLFLGHLVGKPILDHKIDPEALQELASFFKIPKHANLIEETQKTWLRKPGCERWEMEELSSDQKDFVLKWASKAGFFSPWKGVETTYDKALILGATTNRMKRRLEFLKELWNDGVRFDEIVWLTGKRPLDSRIEDFADRCSDESQAARLIWEETSFPGELTVTFIEVPMKDGGKRPDTRDTILAWLEKFSIPCKCVFVSDQPFCGYQFGAIKACMPEEFLFDVVGNGETPQNHGAAAITLDSIARWIYVDNCR